MVSATSNQPMRASGKHLCRTPWPAPRASRAPSSVRRARAPAAQYCARARAARRARIRVADTPRGVAVDRHWVHPSVESEESG